MDIKQSLWPGWETVRIIGHGSFGAVYEIERKLFEDDEPERAALKVITIPQNNSDIEEMYNDGYNDESITSVFKSHLKNIVAEYSLMRKMNGSSNVVNCDDVRYVQHDNGIGWNIYIKMELLTPLAKALPAQIPEDQVIRIAKDMCAALELCSKHNIIHRDIKPQNIFVSDNGDYKLGDFGIAKTIEGTAGGTKTGTYKYMAPEVYNNKPYGASADIYSLGLVLYWMLNERRMPFLPLPPEALSAGMDEKARQRRFSGEQIPAPKNGSKALKAIVLKACAFNPKNRYQSAREMREDLQRLSGRAAARPASRLVVPATKPNEAVEKTAPIHQNKPVEAVRPTEPVQIKAEEKMAAESWDKTVYLDEDDPEKTVGPVNEERKPKKKKKVWPLAVIAACLVAVIALMLFVKPKRPEIVYESEPEKTVLETAPKPKPQYTLMEEVDGQTVLGSEHGRSQIASITFMDTTRYAAEDTWDVSRDQDGTVLAWVLPNGDLLDLYIGAEGGVLAPENCRFLFAYYSYLNSINFNGAFDTSDVTDMSYMFFSCKELPELDVSGFDTSKVTNMGWMFYWCRNLTELDLSGFDTSNVTNMKYMFYGCNDLTELDISNFDVSKVDDYTDFMDGDKIINGRPWWDFFKK